MTQVEHSVIIKIISVRMFNKLSSFSRWYALFATTRLELLHDKFVIPSPPKKASTAYNIFQAEKRAELKADSKVSLSAAELNPIISQAWKNINEQEKKHYEQASGKQKEQVSQQLKKYNQTFLKPFEGKVGLYDVISARLEETIPAGETLTEERIQQQIQGLSDEQLGLLVEQAKQLNEERISHLTEYAIPNKKYNNFSDYLNHQLSEMGKQADSLTAQETQQLEANFETLFADYQNRMRQLAGKLEVELSELVRFLSEIDSNISVSDFPELEKPKSTKARSIKKEVEPASAKSKKKTLEDLSFEGSLEIQTIQEAAEEGSKVVKQKKTRAKKQNDELGDASLELKETKPKKRASRKNQNITMSPEDIAKFTDEEHSELFQDIVTGSSTKTKSKKKSSKLDIIQDSQGTLQQLEGYATKENQQQELTGEGSPKKKVRTKVRSQVISQQQEAEITRDLEKMSVEQLEAYLKSLQAEEEEPRVEKKVKAKPKPRAPKQEKKINLKDMEISELQQLCLEAQEQILSKLKKKIED